MPYKDIEKAKKWREDNKEKLAEYNKKYREDNREILNERQKNWLNKSDNRNKRKEYNKKYYHTLQGRFNNAKHGAEKRKKSFTITFEEFCEITSKPCCYCDDQMGFQNKAGSKLDRIDSSVGYEINNVISCCWICNKIKNDILTFEETKVAVNAILQLRKQSFPVNKIDIV